MDPSDVLTLQWGHNEPNGVSNHRCLGGLLNRLFRRRSKKTSKLRVTGLCAGDSPMTSELPSKRASNAENASIWWCHRVMDYFTGNRPGASKVTWWMWSKLTFTKPQQNKTKREPCVCSLGCTAHLKNMLDIMPAHFHSIAHRRSLIINNSLHQRYPYLISWNRMMLAVVPIFYSAEISFINRWD